MQLKPNLDFKAVILPASPKETEMAYQDVQKVAEKRRTIYALNKNLPLPAAEVAKSDSEWMRDVGSR